VYATEETRSTLHPAHALAGIEQMAIALRTAFVVLGGTGGCFVVYGFYSTLSGCRMHHQ
jgi:hypothetical protein